MPTSAWLAINIWHNLQYLLVVWMVNVKRYAGRVDADEPLLSRISQPGRPVTYFACCLVITTLVYFSLNGSPCWRSAAGSRRRLVSTWASTSTITSSMR